MTDITRAIIVFSISVFIIWIGVRRLIANYTIRKNGIKAKGFVYEMNGKAPVVRFLAKDEKWITAQHRTSGIYEKGDTVAVGV